MATLFYITQEGQNPAIDLDVDIFRSSLPQEIILESRKNGLYAIVASIEPEDASTQQLIDRELDRLYFLTCVRLHAEMIRRPAQASYSTSNRIHGKIPEGLAQLSWSDELTLQLKLWSIAIDSTDYIVRILLYYQIIEVSYPKTDDKENYPTYEYVDKTKPPIPRTEAKLLRNLIAHAGVARTETNEYLKFLGLPSRLSNLTYPDWHKKILERLPILEQQARELLQNKIS